MAAVTLCGFNANRIEWLVDVVPFRVYSPIGGPSVRRL